MNSLVQLYIAAFLLSIFFGIIARRTDFCPLGGIADVMKTGNSGRFYMYIFAIGIAIMGATFLEFSGLLSFDNTRPPYRMPQFRWSGYILGGFLFGFGMTLCRGCGMKNMLNLGSGDIRALIAVLGMAMAGYALLYVDDVMGTYFGWMNALHLKLGDVGIPHQDLGSIGNHFLGGDVAIWRMLLGLTVALLFIRAAFNSSYFTRRKSNIVGGFLVGSIIIGAYYLSGGSLGQSAAEASEFLDEPQYGMGMQSYTFIRPMGDTLQVLKEPFLYLITLGLVMFVGVGVGSAVYCVSAKKFKLQGFTSVLSIPRYLIGGLLVGIGGILGMGCTLGQGLAGTSTLALGSFIDLVALIAGAYVGIKLQPHFMDDHVIPE